MTIRLLLTAFLLTTSSIRAQAGYPYVIKTLAGAYPLGNGGPATSALLEFPSAAVFDNNGNLYIADGDLHGIRKVSANGTISVFSPLYAADLKIDASGNFFGTDGVNAVFKITASGAATLIAGGTNGSGGDGGLATAARLSFPAGIALDALGNIYIADTLNCRIRKVTADGKIQTIAGNGIAGSSGDGAPAISAELAYPQSIALDAAGNLYIAEEYRIRKVNTSGIISTIAGNGLLAVDGPAITSAIGSTVELMVDAQGSLYLADSDYSLVRVISNGTIQTVAGRLVNGNPTYDFTGDGGQAASADLNFPTAVITDSNRNLYIVDQDNSRVRKVSTSGIITTIAGAAHYGGDNGAATAAIIHLPAHAVTDAAGDIYFSDTQNNRIRKVTPGGIITTIAGAGPCTYSGDGGQAISATFCQPNALALDAAGNLYVADSYNAAVRRIGSNGIITTYAGTGNYADSGDGGPAASAELKYPFGLTLDAAGTLYISDQDSNRIRQVSASGMISPFAGTGAFGSNGDGGQAGAAKLGIPGQLAVDAAGNLYLADLENYRVRKVSKGIITTVAGIPTCCALTPFAVSSYIGAPGGLAVDKSGNLFVSLPDFGSIAAITPAGALSIIAGTGVTGFSGDGGLAASATLNRPAGLSVDSAGNIYVADQDNSRIRELILDFPVGITVKTGDGQSGAVSTALPIPLNVSVAFNADVGAGAPVSFVVSSGSATLSAAITNTDSTGLAGVTATLGSAPGPVIVTATLAGLSPVQFHLTAVSAVSGPVIATGGVAGAGGSIPAVAAISPGGFASVFGANFAASGTARQVQAGDIVNGTLPTQLAGVCVQTGGVPAYLTYVTPGQINFQVPNVPLNSSVNVQVIANCGTSSALSSNSVAVAAQAATPEFLYWVQNASGRNPVIALNAVTGGNVGAAGLISGLNFLPAKPGDVLTIYAISFGPTNPSVAPGTPSAAAAATTNTPSVTFGTALLSQSSVLYAGFSPGIPGLYQLNIVVPANLPDGDYPLTLSLGSFSTPAGGYITVKN